MDTPSPKKPPIFIVGAPRSGTGLLRDLLRSHPNLSIPRESHFIPQFYALYGDPASTSEARSVARRILGFGRVQMWDLDLQPEDFDDCRSFRAIIERIYSTFAASEGKRRWGDKTPAYVLHLSTLTKIFTHLKVLHIIRDGRAVALSWAAHPAGPGNLYTAACDWQAHVRVGRRTAHALPTGSYLEVSYEALLADPESTLAEVYAFLGEEIPDEPIKLSPPLQLGARGRHRISFDEIVADNAEAWRRRISPRQRRLVESVAGELLAELGYDVEGPVRPIPTWRGRFWRIHAFATYYARLTVTPERLRTNATLFLAERRNDLRRLASRRA